MEKRKNVRKDLSKTKRGRPKLEDVVEKDTAKKQLEFSKYALEIKLKI